MLLQGTSSNNLENPSNGSKVSAAESVEIVGLHKCDKHYHNHPNNGHLERMAHVSN